MYTDGVTAAHHTRSLIAKPTVLHVTLLNGEQQIIYNELIEYTAF